MKSLSFSQKLIAGWAKADLMRYYALDEKQYNKVVASLEEVQRKALRPN